MLPILNLNKHPKDCENLSLIDALNVRLSNDGSCLQSENAILSNRTIRNYIANYYDERFHIIKMIPCNTELIIIAASDSDIQNPDINRADIFRYNEELRQIKLVYRRFEYHKGKINGTFTYNVNNELIVSIAEYDAKESVPLRTINFGKFEDDIGQLPNELLSVNPKVNIPTLDGYDYVPGNLPKGWYYVFIRYKIDNNDYTNWYPISDKILISLLEKQNIIKYYGRIDISEKTEGSFVTGAYDYFNSDDDLSNSNIKLNIINLDNNYKYYQVGCIFVSKDNNKSYISDDILISKRDYVISLSNMFEHDVIDLITNTYTPYDVKNVINYQNRLYISNYKEKLLDSYDTSNIQLSLVKDKLSLYDIKKLQYIEVSGSQDYIERELSNAGLVDDLGEFEPIIVKDLEIDGIKTNTDLYEDINLTDFSVAGQYTKTYKIKFTDKDISDSNLGKFIKINRKFNIKSNTGYIKQIEFCAEFELFEHLASFANIYFKFTNSEGKEYYTNHGFYDRYVNFETKEYYVEFALRRDSPYLITKTALNEDQIILDGVNTTTFINTKQSFEERTKNTTLIPGEVYNFFIHFVDKYGQATRGFKLQNNIEEEVVEVPLNGFVFEDSYGNTVDYNDWYYVIDPNTRMYDDIGKINIKHTDCVRITDGSHHACMQQDYNNNLKDFLENKYKNFKNIKNITWGQLPDIGTSDEFSIYTNANGDKLFKIPYDTINVKTDIENVLHYEVNLNSLSINGVQLPEGYVGYFISYEKPNYLAKVTGFLTKYDANQEYTSNRFQSYNKQESKYMRFYSSDFDINDSVDLNYNVIRIEKKNAFKESDNFNRLENGSIDYIANLNVAETEEIEQSSVRYFYIKDYVVEVADDYVKDRFGLSTVLKIPIINDLFPNDEINTYKATLMYIDENIYTNTDKTLIKCSNIIYENTTPKFTFDGLISYNDFLIYNHNRFEFNQTDKIVYSKSKEKYYNDKQKNSDTAKFVHYIQMPVYKHYFYETKSFKNNPQNIIYNLENIDLEEDLSDYKLESGTIVEPKNSIDLFTNKYNIEDINVKTYFNHRNDVKYISHYSKFIRRSNIIQDESLSNAWRRFELENYKIISENKGDITNLIGIGTYLIVHTEHSIFLFNNDNVLKTQNRDVQLEMPDIFSMDYKELVTSKLGYCGLQDSDAYVLGEFGYIFYDNDAYRLYKFDNGSIDVIDNDIVQFLKKYKPNKIKFAHDQYSNRILLNIEYTHLQHVYNKTLSYNYKINKFISFHEYVFHEAVNTKNKLYMSSKYDIYNIDYSAEIQNYIYNQFENGNGEIRSSKLDIIINDNYNIIKQLEYIIYKLYKIKVSTSNYNNNPVEEHRVPYSGEKIRIYNNEVDTGWLDIKINTEEAKNIFSNYEKPYWDLGNWNFSYLRNKLSEQLGSDFMSKLYGNYFIVSIMFGDSNERVEFESLGYNITKDRRI